MRVQGGWSGNLPPRGPLSSLCTEGDRAALRSHLLSLPHPSPDPSASLILEGLPRTPRLCTLPCPSYQIPEDPPGVWASCRTHKGSPLLQGSLHPRSRARLGSPFTPLQTGGFFSLRRDFDEGGDDLVEETPLLGLCCVSSAGGAFWRCCWQGRRILHPGWVQGTPAAGPGQLQSHPSRSAPCGASRGGAMPCPREAWLLGTGIPCATPQPPPHKPPQHPSPEPDPLVPAEKEMRGVGRAGPGWG